ncbi:transcription antitermination factor NusB [Microlunatus ginsengisoli]|uniref:Transcription antitermination protein NusB n=1 Tax=Microlunatus ginsengisoli TaxID=363863 RepID=A0ABP7ADY2_9ACTN
MTAHQPTHSSSRSKARKRALDVLFEAELRGTDPLATLAERSADADPPVRDYTKILVEGVVAHQAEIDARISGALAAGWTLPRMPRVDRNTLRIAIFETDQLGLPDAVAISEAVALVTDLSTDESPAFVNGVLGTLSARRPAAERPAAAG